MEMLPDFRLHRPSSIGDAIALRSAHPAARFLAGGTDLMPALRRGLVDTSELIDLTGVAGLAGIEDVEQQGMRIGAATTLAQLAGCAAVLERFPILAQAALSVAGPTHRVSATVGGNLCLDTRCRYYNQSETWRRANSYCMKLGSDACRVARKATRCFAAFSGDLAPALLVLDAEVEIVGKAARRRIPLAQLYADDGKHFLQLAPDELLVAVHVPARPGWRAAYEKVRLRAAIDFALAGIAVALRCDKGCVVELRIACTGTNAFPLGLRGLETLRGRRLDAATLAQVDQLFEEQINIMETTVASSLYRRRVAMRLIPRLLLRLAT
jgi:4-hydroxybenzoyl-CoA reductase subunit beta